MDHTGNSGDSVRELSGNCKAGGACLAGLTTLKKEVKSL
jgi:hypothetical protein